LFFNQNIYTNHKQFKPRFIARINSLNKSTFSIDSKQILLFTSFWFNGKKFSWIKTQSKKFLRNTENINLIAIKLNEKSSYSEKNSVK
jgi:hypothetical protein